MTQHLLTGAWGERLALEILTCQGYTLLEKNWRPQPLPGEPPLRGEIDAVLLDPETNLIFLEVKTRTTQHYGHPFEAIHHGKTKKLKQLAYHWCATHEMHDIAHIQLDAVAITGTPEKFTFEHLKKVS
ncbi:YraN family protein [Rothia sp. P7181]|uniref:YraN family protein n=1 Tax=unclassified Rothia (in: high G+C Gram-positive bacteria) TaxID=2689056 RepID=UPI003AEDE37A